MPPISIPTKAALSPSQRLPTNHPSVRRIIGKASRPSLLSLVLDWLDERNQALTAPYLADDADDNESNQLYPAARSLEELREYYTDLQASKGSKKDILDRIIYGDWRNGVSLYQLAMAEMLYLYDHPNSQRWMAMKVVPLQNEEESIKPGFADGSLPSIPRFHPSTFLQNLQNEILPDVKAHYNLDRHPTLPILLLRIFILDSPYNTSLGLTWPRTAGAETDLSRTVYVAFPDASAHVFVSLATNNSPPGGDTTRNLRNLLQDAIPKAFSRPRARYALEPVSLAVRTLESLCASRGSGRTNAAAGGWGLYAEQKKRNTPLDLQLPSPPESSDELRKPASEREVPKVIGLKRKLDDGGQEAIKRRRLVAQARFGSSGKADDRKGIERLDIRFEDPFPALTNLLRIEGEEDADVTRARGPERKRRRGRPSAVEREMRRFAEDDAGEERGWIPDIRMTFHGSHVFAGVRELVEAGVVNGERMPGWMTGEEGVSIGIVKGGRIQGFKGSGI